MNLLLNKGASLNVWDKQERQPLHWAAFLGEKGFTGRAGIRCLRFLGQGRGGCSLQKEALHKPSLRASSLFPGHLEVLKLLVARGADLGCKDRKGYGLLHTAAASGQIEVVKYLLRMGAEVRVLSLGAGD